MKRLTFLIATTAVTAAASPSVATGAEVEVLSEDFGNPAGLSGWGRLNHSVPFGADLTVEGDERFALRYLGDPATLGHVGLDTMRVVTAMPEPAGLLVLASSLGVIGLMQRRERH